MNAGAPNTQRRSNQQPYDSRRDAAPKRLHLLIAAKPFKRRSGRKRHQKSRQKNTDRRHQRSERSGYSISNKCRRDQNRTRRDLSERECISELLMRQPVMIVHDFRLDQRNHYQTAAKRDTADAEEDRGERKQQSKLRSDRHRDSQHADGSKRRRFFAGLFSRVLTLRRSTQMYRTNKAVFP